MELAARCRIHILRHVGTGTHKDGIITGTEETVDGDIVFAHHTVGDKLHTQGSNLAHFIAHHSLWQAILRNTVHQYATRFSLSFKNRYIESLSCQITGYGKSCRTRTDYSHSTTGFLWQELTGELHLGIEVSDKLLQFTNLYRFSLLAEHTMSLTLLLVRTHASTDCRQIALGIDDAHRSTHVTHRQFVYEIRYIVFNRASLLTLRNLAMQTSLGFLNRLSGSESLVYHLKHARLFSCVILLINLFTHNLLLFFVFCFFPISAA